MSAQSDPVLLERYALSGDDADFRPLVDRYASVVYGACLDRLGRRELAEDAAQAVCSCSSPARPRRCAIGPPSLLGCSPPAAMSRCAWHARNVGAGIGRPPWTRGVASPPPADALTLAEALGRLRGMERDAVTLRFVHELSLAEVGRSASGSRRDAARMRVSNGLWPGCGAISRPSARLPLRSSPVWPGPSAAPAPVIKLATPRIPHDPHLSPAPPLRRRHADESARRSPRDPTPPKRLRAAPRRNRFPSPATAPATSAPATSTALAPPRVPKDEVQGTAVRGVPRERPGLVREAVRRAGRLDGNRRPASPATHRLSSGRCTTGGRSLGAAKGRTASATYPIGGAQTPFAKVLSIGFDGPGRTGAGRHARGSRHRPEAEPEPGAGGAVRGRESGGLRGDRNRTLQGVPGNLRFTQRKHPEIMLEANDLNDTWHISLRLDPLQGR